MSVAKKVSIGVLGFAGVLALGLGVLLGTNPGLQVVKNVLEKSVADFKAEALEGSVFHLKAKGIEYNTAGVAFKGNLTWDISAAKLLTWRFDLNNFELSDATVRVRTSQMSSSAAPEATTAAASTADAAARLSAPLPVSIDRFVLKTVQADVDGNVLEIGTFETKASWKKDRVVVDSIALQDSSFAAATEPSDETLGAVLKRTFSQPVLPEIPAVNLPVDLTLNTFELAHFTLKGEPDQVIDSVKFSLSAENGKLTVSDLSAQALNANVTGSLALGLDARHEVALTAAISTTVPRESIPTGTLPQAEEPSVEEVANFYERLKEAREERLNAAKERRAKRLAQAKTQPEVQKKVLSREEQREARRKARARLQRRVERWRASVRGMLPKAQPLPPVTVELALQAQGALSEEVMLSGNVNNVPGVENGVFTVKATPTQAGLPLSADITAKAIEISGAKLSKLKLGLTGKAVDYALDVSAQALYPLDEEHNITANIAIRGTGTEVRAALKDFSIASNIGLIHIDGAANWSDNLRFAASLNLNDIDTTAAMPQTPLKANGSFVAWGVQQNGVWKAKLQDLTILGELRGHSLALTGAFETKGNGVLETPELYIAVGDNTFEIAGHIDAAKEVPELNFKAKIDAPDFALIDPNLLGSVKGQLVVSGTSALPVIDADITARNIDYLGTTLKKGRLTGRIRSHDSISGRASLELEDLKTNGVVVRKASIQARGSELRHQITIKTEGEPVSVQAKITGIYERMLGNWAGSIAEFKADSDYGPVSLEKPLRLAYVSGLNRANVGKACFVHPDAKLCLQNALKIDLTNKTDLRLLIGLEKFDLAFIKHYLKGRLRANGIITAQADITVPAGLADLPRGKVRVQAKDIKTRYRMDNGDLRVGFNELDIGVANIKDSIAARWKVDIADNGDIEGNLSVGDIFGSRSINGALNLVDIDATLVNSFLSPGETAEGKIYGSMRFAGNLEEPLIYGETGIKSARLDSTKMPFEMLPSDFKLTFDGNSSNLDGLLKTPKGEIKLAGAADWRTFGEGKAVVSAKGVNLRVTLPPDVEFDLTTDVKCEASSELIKLDGLIALPWARVQVSELPPSTVEVSDDVVRVDRPRLIKKDRSQAIPIESNLFIDIGDDVRVEAMGLKARVTGKLHVIQDKGNLGLTGQISVPSGNFKAYGQDLIVRRGEFHFIGSTTNPMIDLEAIRNPERTADDVIAGVRITGTADYPQVSVFSDPVKSETEALSYLIRGEGLDPSGDSDNTMITSALINLGLSQGSQVFESLGDAIGISGLGLDTEGVGDNSQLVVSGYVLPGLKVKYGVGIFDSLATLTLRYRVIPKLYIEAVSGVDQALDVLYSFEF